MDEPSIQRTLDELILSYLDLIDVYSRLQEDVSQSMSSGFFSIAQANYNSSGRWYGQDFYDGRMKAMKGVEIIAEDDSKPPMFRLTSFSLEGDGIIQLEKKEPEQQATLRRRKPEKEQATAESRGRESEDDIQEGKGELQDEKTEESASAPVKRDPRDPIKWFGILVPMALKNAQRNFSNAVGKMPDLVNVLRKLDQYEKEIQLLRKQLKGDHMDRKLDGITISSIED
ncbi:hypothetical protein BDZ91DRAFT_708696 [Kalaharituber pfeilii]|nr:hypothetical protein BDZ91DRAFT_708696 [Kalaharituber pfeilii]